MTVEFDNTPSRDGTYSFKWEKYKGKDILPAWVADTEFRCAEPILQALTSKLEHGNLGYVLPAQYTPASDAVVRWLNDKHNWQIEPEWIVWTPGVVPGFNIACKAYCQPGDKVAVQVPNYPPLLAAPQINGLERLDVPTRINDARPTIDFEVLETQLSDPKCKLFIMCNPMNPVGTVLNDEELSRVVALCDRYNVVLCSDEIHCDLILEPGVSHIPAGRKDPRAVTIMAANKSFNIAGLGAAFAIIPDAKMRVAFTKASAGIVPWVNVMGLIATEAAFTQCDDWHTAQLDYLRTNRDETFTRINAIAGLTMHRPEATFLAWVNAQGLGVSDVQVWAESKGVGPSPGRDFLAPEYFRINYGCSRQLLDAILTRLEA